MHAFGSPRALAYDSRHGHRRVPAALAQDADGGLDPRCVILAIHDEDGLARNALAATAADAGPEERTPEALRIYEEAELARWPGFPQRLGRLDAAPAVIDSPAPLPAQLATLRDRRPGRRRFRIALVGGFGSNLGDMLLGATAWRILHAQLQAALPDVGADVLLGPAAHPAAGGLIGHEEGIDGVSFVSSSLAEFSRYDAFFDFSGLVTLPRFHDGAALDWILWWLGLDPAAVDASSKRNRLTLPHAALDWARGRLAERAGPRVAFVWRASTPLRSMPDDVARRFAADLLEAVEDVTLVTERTLGLDHPRLLDLGRDADSAERMMGLVSEVDGLVSIDSLAPHVADAADVPCVMLLASLDPSRFPFYPGMDIVVPPGMEALPGWGVTKVSDAGWTEMQAGYEEAWTRLSAPSVGALLQGRMAARPAPHGRRRVSASRPWHEARPVLPAAGAPFPHDRMRDPQKWIAGEIVHFGGQILIPGHTAVLAGGGDGGIALALARAVAPHGALHVMEPRRLRAQKLAADAQAGGIAILHFVTAMADEEGGRQPIADFDPANDSDPCAWGNLHHTVAVDAMPLDRLPVEDCRLLAIFAPQAVRPALAGAVELLRRTAAWLAAGPVPAADYDAVRALLATAGYRGWCAWPDRARFDGALLLAVPVDAEASFDGLEPL